MIHALLGLLLQYPTAHAEILEIQVDRYHIKHEIAEGTSFHERWNALPPGEQWGRKRGGSRRPGDLHVSVSWVDSLLSVEVVRSHRNKRIVLVDAELDYPPGDGAVATWERGSHVTVQVDVDGQPTERELFLREALVRVGPKAQMGVAGEAVALASDPSVR